MAVLINAAEARLAVRDRIDQVAYGVSVTRADIAAEGFSKISDDEIDDRLTAASIYVASRVGDTHLPELILPFDGSQDPPLGFMRLVDDRMLSNGTKARRISYRAFRSLGPSRQPSATFPVYMFEDCDLTMVGGLGPFDAAAVMTPGGVIQMRQRLFGAIVARATELCFMILRRPDLAEIASADTGTSLDPFKITFVKK